ncbi:PX domain-containing protein [Mycena indigotica]|uniref:COX assembly mitochondrial protein n=1 Tax=Mycena indigotica TaxID=2126181 RepID=A0A8H6WH00_9AGAR|nr:PX domain-containing protein [Mycena indigotica]KAF7316456.1 PX domain-containing protein [Mycena indigotica]
MSGFSFTGGPSRCNPYWQEFAKCYSKVSHPSQCANQRDDYLECLHHKKEKARLAAIQTELQNRTLEDLQEYKKKLDAQVEGVPVRVGLIPPTDEAK